MPTFREMSVRVLKLSAIGVAGAGLVVAGQAVTSATSSHPTHIGPAGPSLGNQVKHQVSTPNETLKKTVIVSGFSGSTLATDDFTPVDAGETMVCPGTTKCTIEAIMSVQAQGTGANNEWGVCLFVDGHAASCPYIGYLDSSFYENGTITEKVSGLSHGSHTVQTKVFTASGGTEANYTLTYHAYTP